jgi:hypothetical protein
MEILLVEAELFCANRWADRQTDMTKLIVACRDFAEKKKLKILKQELEDSRLLYVNLRNLLPPSSYEKLVPIYRS